MVIPADILLEETKCYACLGISLGELLMLGLEGRMVGSLCGVNTGVLEITHVGNNPYEGTYTQTSPTLWTQTLPIPDYGIRLVAGVWEVFELVFPPPIYYSIPEADFPCGTWTIGVGVGAITAEYV